MIDYTTMRGPDLLSVCGDNAEKWADAFIQHHKVGAPMDHGDVIGWFANAIENADDVRIARLLLGTDEDFEDHIAQLRACRLLFAGLP